ncbi:hypothetical protein HA402_004789 [Bradysia odoriphaga]|nr:hypothetical protein HA402_004789 [Bradysia odoriphaga]
MNFLKFIVTAIVLQTVLTVECCIIDRKVNQNGLFVPRIDRVFIPQDKILDPTTPIGRPNFQTVQAEEIPMYHLITNILDQIPVVTYVDPQFNFGGKIKEKYNFRLNKFTPANSRQVIYALEFHSDADLTAQSNLDTHAYWCPQGKYVDVPIHPNIRGDPRFVFTPTFSGCTLAVDLIEKPVAGGRMEKFYRVYHVQGGKENAEYNDLDYHGLGMVTSMEYRNYGYFRPEIGKPDLYIENVIGSAFMAYHEQQAKWIIYHQSQYGPNGYLVVSKILHVNGRKEITASIPENTIVAKSALLSVKATVSERTVVPYHEARVAKKVFVAEVHKEIAKKKADDNSNKFNCA